MKNVPLAHCPLGTGNDLARACGWGPGLQDAKKAISDFLVDVSEGQDQEFDRWNLTIDEPEKEKQSKSMNNYFSIGVDAKIATKFHSMRSSDPHLFKNQTVNKMWYGKLGADAMISGCPGLEKCIQLNVDGVDLDLSVWGEMEAVCVMNIPSIYGGAHLWISDQETRQRGLTPCSISDGLLEIVALKSSFHLGNVQAGIASPIIIGQGKSIQFKILETSYVQLDGEPWIQEPATLSISLLKKSTLLISNSAHPTVLRSASGDRKSVV